jgi:hypothetical protein
MKKKLKHEKEKTDFDRIVWSDDLLDKLLAGGAVFILVGLLVFIGATFSHI